MGEVILPDEAEMEEGEENNNNKKPVNKDTERPMFGAKTNRQVSLVCDHFSFPSGFRLPLRWRWRCVFTGVLPHACSLESSTGNPFAYIKAGNKGKTECH